MKKAYCMIFNNCGLLMMIKFFYKFLDQKVEMKNEYRYLFFFLTPCLSEGKLRMTYEIGAKWQMAIVHCDGRHISERYKSNFAPVLYFDKT